MAKTFDLDSIDDRQEVLLIASISDKEFAYRLLMSSAFNDDQKYVYEDILFDEITIERLDEIVHILKMNQSEPKNPKMGEIQYLLTKRIERDRDL